MVREHLIWKNKKKSPKDWQKTDFQYLFRVRHSKNPLEHDFPHQSNIPLRNKFHKQQDSAVYPI